MVLIINGEPTETAATRIPGLLNELGVDSGFVAVAVNREVVRRAEWPNRPLADGDEVEVVTPRQGG